MKSREVVLARRPVGMPTAEDFAVREVELGEPGSGEVLVRNICMSVDPYMRGRMIDRRSYTPPFAVGETLTGGAIGRVVQSNDPDLPEGEHVESHQGWREAFVAKSTGVRRLGNLEAPASAYLGVLGMPGMTAYVGLLDVGALKEGETVFVSGAAGAVGSAVGQIAKIKGCTAIGSAGSADKVRHLTEDLGFDHAFDYHGGHLERQIFKGCPGGRRRLFRQRRRRPPAGSAQLHAAGRPDSPVWRHRAVQRHGTRARAQQPRHRHRHGLDDQGLHRLQLQPPARRLHARHDGLGDEREAQIPGDGLRRHRAGARGVHRALHRGEHRQDGRQLGD